MIKHLTLAIAFAFLTIVSPADAGPDRVSLLLGSDHIGGSGFDGRNPGIFLTWEDRGPGLDLSVGVYRNSYGRGSLAATLALPVARWRDGSVSIFAGAALYPGHGRHFRMHAGDVVPIGGLQVQHRNAFLQIMPSDGGAVDAVIAMGLTFSLE